MEAERQRHGVGAARVHGEVDLQASVLEAGVVDELVAEREHLEQLGHRVVPSQPRRQRAAVASRRARHLPRLAAADHAVDREAVALELDPLGVVRDPDGAPAGP